MGNRPVDPGMVGALGLDPRRALQELTFGRCCIAGEGELVPELGMGSFSRSLPQWRKCELARWKIVGLLVEAP